MCPIVEIAAYSSSSPDPTSTPGQDPPCRPVAIGLPADVVDRTAEISRVSDRVEDRSRASCRGRASGGARIRRAPRGLGWVALVALHVVVLVCGMPTSSYASAGGPKVDEVGSQAVAGAAETSAGEAMEGAEEGLREELRRLVGSARDQVFPALVSIQVVTSEFSGGKEYKGQVVGSGTIVSAEGHVVTNEHVTRNGSRFSCTLSDQRRVDAVLVGEDPLTDLAVLRLDLEALGEPAPPVARFGVSAELEVGDVIMAMGSPFSLSRSVSLGIVSNTERVFAGGFGSDDLDEMELEGGQRTGLFTRWIQHDAQISPGNSGGPLVNLAGEIVGVNELGGGALSFAIPSDLARRVSAELIERGEVERSRIGLSIRPIRGTGHEEGVLVRSVAVDGPADRAGIEAGDLVLRLDGEPTTVRFAEEVPLWLDSIASRPVGSTLELEIRRGLEADEPGPSRTVRLVTERLERDVGEERAFPVWGVTARQITPKMARDRRLDDTGGVLITGVRRAGPAEQAEPTVERGDILRAVDDRPVLDLDDLIERYAETIDERGQLRAPLVLALDRKGQQLITVVEPRDSTTQDPPRELPKAWIGIATQPILPALARSAGFGERTGFRITRIYPGTLAAEAGLRVGDLVVAVDGEPVAPRGMQDAALLARRVRGLEIGETATLEVLRDGEAREVEVELERTRLDRAEARRHVDRDFELTVRELTFFDRDERRWEPEVRGVLVENVDPGGWASLGGLRPGDLIQQIEGQPVRGLRSFRAALESVKTSRAERVVVVVLRGVRVNVQFLEPDWTPADGDR